MREPRRRGRGRGHGAKGPRVRVAALTPAVGIAAAVVVGLAGAAHADLDCLDFDSPEEAQDYYDRVSGDPDRLDRDGDGLACEPYDGDTSPWVWAVGGGVATAVVIGLARAR